MKPILRRMLSGVLSVVTTISTIPIIPVNADESTEPYPYTMFAASSDEGAITINSGNFGINGRIATNGTVELSSANNISQFIDNNICEEMIYIPNCIDRDFFSTRNIETINDDYEYENVNIHVNTPLSVNGTTILNGNVTIQSGLKSLDDITILGDVQNCGNTVIYSKYGNIEIEGNNANISGLIYAPFGNVSIKAGNVNLNNTMIIANTINIESPNINANNSEHFSRYFGEVSDEMIILESDYQYFVDDNSNNIPDFFENSINWKYLQDSDDDGVPDIIEVSIGTDPNYNEEDYNEMLDKYTLEMMYKIPLILQNSETSEMYIYGDLNNDLIIDSFDLVLMRKTYSNHEYIEIADLDGDKDLDSDDLIYLVDFLLAKRKSFPIYANFDSDDDGLSDYIEVEITGTSPHKADTDSDELSDFDEIIYTRTSPIEKYTRGLSVTDANDDPDEDNLSNKEELLYNTDANLYDSDNDGISDYDELKLYNTDPNNEDSDDDYISDGDELELGLSPNSDKTDGDNFDYNRTFEHILSPSDEKFSLINTFESPYEVSIEIKSAGNVNKALSVQTGGFSNASENERIIGKCLSFSYNDNFRIENAKIKYKLTSSDDNICNYMIFEFFPENNYLLPAETKYTSDTAYIETNELGSYCLVNIEEFYTSTINSENTNNNSIFSNNLIYDYDLGEIEVAFFVDISGYIDDNLEETKNSIRDFSQALFEHSDKATVEIIGYYSSPTSVSSRVITYKDNSNCELLTSTNSLNEALNKISSYTNNRDNSLDSAIYLLNDMCNDRVFSSNCNNKYAFIISDSEYTFTSNIGYTLTIPNITQKYLKYLFDKNIHLNFLLSSENYRCTKGRKNLETVCSQYDFDVYEKSKTGYFADDAYAKIYSDAVVDIKSLPIGYTSSISPNVIPTNVERNAFINSLSSSYDKSKVPAADSNGNINFKEAAVKVGAAIYDKNGNVVFDSLFNVCNISELTRKGYEQLMLKLSISEKLISGSVQITPFSEKIMFDDNDGDGIPNKDDPFPYEPFDKKFEIVSDYNYEPTIDYVERHYKNSQNCYDSVLPNPNVLGKIATLLLTALNDSRCFAENFVPHLNQAEFNFGMHEERADYSPYIEHAFNAMKHFFWGNGKEVYYSENETCEMISSSVQNIMHLFDNINITMRCSEEILKDGNKTVIALKSEQMLKAACLIDKSDLSIDNSLDKVECVIESESLVSKSHQAFYCNYVHRDWNLTIGEALGTIVAKIERNGDQFIMNYRYYFKDIYEWAYHYENDPQGSISTPLHAAHESGIAQEYLMQGYFEGYLSWTIGDEVTCRNVAQQLFLTLADKEDGLGNNPDVQWNNSNEVERFKKLLSMEW